MSAEPVVHRYASFASLREGSVFDVALSEVERAERDRLRDPGRREAWTWGRVVAKRLLQEQLPNLADRHARIEILSRDPAGKSVRPAVRVDSTEFDVSLSIAHSDRGVLAALSSAWRIGVDLVDLASFRPGSLDAWFTPAERALLRDGDVARQATLWGIKEAVYKAANEGEPFAPKRIEVACDRDYRFTYGSGERGDDHRRIHIREIDGHIAAFAMLAVGLITAIPRYD